MPKNNSKKNPEKKERLILLDAHAIIHRAYHALPDFATSKGEPTGALYGLVSMVLKIATDFSPDYLVACFDLPKPTYRHEVYDAYKAGRAKTDDNLSLQLEKSKEVCTVLNIPIYSKEGFEADDMLGTIVEQIKKEDIDTIIASGDMDTLQLVGRGVQVYTLKKGIHDTVLYDEGKVQERFGFVPTLLPDFKGLRGDPSDNIIGIEGIGEKTATDLMKEFGGIDDIYKSLNKGLLEGKVKPRIISLLKEGEEEARFSKMLATIRRDAPIKFELPDKKWKEGIDMSKVRRLFADLEFRNMNQRLEQVIGIDSVKEIEVEEDIDQNLLEETKIALWVVDSNITDPGTEDIFNFSGTKNFVKSRETILNELKKRDSEFVFESIEKPLIPILKKAEEYGVLVDKEVFSVLGQKYSKELGGIEKKIWEHAGGEFNVSSPKQLGEILFGKLGLSVKNQKKTSTGAASTKESELEKMKDLHPIISLVLEHRELRKLLSSYIEPIPKLLDGKSRLHARFIQTGTTTGRMASENPNMQNIPIGSDRGRVIRDAFIAEKGKSLVALDYSQVELRIAAFLSGDQILIDIFKEGKDIHSAVASQIFKIDEKEVTKEMRRQAKVINFGILYGMGVTALQANLGTDRKTAQEFLNSYFENFKGLAIYLEDVKRQAEKNGYTKTFFGRRRYFEGIKSSIPFIKAAAERMAINAPIQGTQADIIKIAMARIYNFMDQQKIEGSLIMQIHDEVIYEISNKDLENFEKNARKIMQEVLSPQDTRGVPIIANVSVGDNWGKMKEMK